VGGSIIVNPVRPSLNVKVAKIPVVGQFEIISHFTE
jgi:hypothetical protein